MAYDDIRISELPSLPELHANDLFLIQDVTNNLAHRIDWGRLKNSIGRLSKGIIFPLGTVEEPEIAIGDYTSGIMAEDYGTFAIVTHGYKRFKVNQAGTMELINGNVVIGNYDRQCTYSLIVNNLTTFNCYTKFGSDVDVDGNLDVGGNITGGKNLNIPGDVILGESCENSLIINSEIRAMCSMDLKGTMSIHEDLFVDNSATIGHDVSLGSSCSDKLDVYSNAWFRCDLQVDGDLSFGGNLLLDGDVSIGSGCNNEIILNGETTVLCNFRVKGETYLEKDLFAFGNANVSGNFIVSGDTQLGADCNNTTYINSALTAECTSFFRDDVTIGDPNFICPGTPLQVNGTLGVMCDVKADEDLYVDHSTFLGTACSDRLVVEATSQFRCHADFDKTVDITEKLTVAGDLEVNGGVVNIGLTPEQIAVNDCAEINLHGNVIIDCNLFVRGDVLYDGDLEIIGPDITFGAGCGLSTIHLQGETIAHCDVIIEGYRNDDALVVKGNTHIQGTELVSGEFTVAKNSFHDADLRVHEDVLLNKPVTSLNYWEQCECIDGVMWGDSMTPPQGPQTNRAPDFFTEIYGTQRSLCHVYLNDPRWYKANNADPHVQQTDIYGSLFARANVVLNSGEAHSSTTNCLQLTQIKGRLVQDCTVILNDTIESNKNMLFNQTPNEEKTIIRGDTRILHNLEVGSNCDELTRINNKFEAKCDAHLNENVELNGGQGASGTTQCDVTTKIFGKMLQYSLVELNKDSTCGPHASTHSFNDANNNRTTIIHGDLDVKASVILNRDGSDATRINGVLDSRTDGRINGHVNLNGAGDGTTKTCKNTTDIWGVLNSHCNVNLNDNCNETTTVKGKFVSECSNILGKPNQCGANDFTTINGSLQLMNGVQLSNSELNGYGNTNVSGGQQGFFISGGGECVRNKWHHAVTTTQGTTYIGASKSSININIAGPKQYGAGKYAGDITISGEAGNGEYKVSAGNGISVTSGSITANQTGNTGQTISFNCATAQLKTHTIQAKPGGAISVVSGPTYTPCAPTTTVLDVAVCPDGGIEVTPCGLNLNPDLTKIDCLKVNVLQSNGVNIGPGTAIIINSGSNAGGMNYNPTNSSVRLCAQVNSGECVAGKLDDSNINVLRAALGGGVGRLFRTECLTKRGGGETTAAGPAWASSTGKGRHQIVVDEEPKGDNDSFLTQEDIDKYADFKLNPGNYTDEDKLENWYHAGDVTISSNLTSSVQTEVDSINLDDAIDKLGTPKSEGGLFRWGMREGQNVPTPDLFIDPSDLGSICPSLVYQEYSNESYNLKYYEGDGWDLGDLKPESERQIRFVALKSRAVQALAFIGIKRVRDRIAAAEAAITQAQATKTTFDDIVKINLASLTEAVDDTAAAAAGVEVSQVYRNGSQLMIRVS